MSDEDRCRFCGYTIVWMETSGWVRHMLGTILWGTERCPSRTANPDAGHALRLAVPTSQVFGITDSEGEQ